uniref:Uncharacterized protein n=1 Tax=Rhizophora mucronata TaxID=61149 RepID=A0A2P2NK52_RHIMU
MQKQTMYNDTTKQKLEPKSKGTVMKNQSPISHKQDFPLVFKKITSSLNKTSARTQSSIKSLQRFRKLSD